MLEIAWSFPFGPNSNRMGVEDIDGSYVYEVAQWYPRLAVYDDVRGWNTEQYLGQGEFYLEYGSFDVSLTVPSRHARGRHRDAAEPGRGADRRPARAAGASPHQRPTVVIRGKDEIGDPASRRRRRSRRSPGASPPTACAISPGPRRGTSCGTPSA